jgi:hypothetical protein
MLPIGLDRFSCNSNQAASHDHGARQSCNGATRSRRLALDIASDSIGVVIDAPEPE